jgi:hypothetical protein
MIGGVPAGRTLIDACAFEERRYVPEIDRMAWGWVEYEEELTLEEVADYELIMKPREDA